ncbi:MAG: ArnT family glycosyltransferase [Anaerolineae bacterium]
MTQSPISNLTSHTPRSTSPIPPRVASLVLVLFVGLVVVMIARTIWTYRDYPFDSDEAIHANSGLAMALDLRAGDLKTFARTFYQQGFYPPAFSVLKAATFLLFGASPLVARLFSLACLPPALLMIYQTSRQLDEGWGWLIGFTAVGLTLTSQPLLIGSALVMMEVPGLLASFGMLWLYLGAIKEPTPWRLAGTSLMLLVTFLTKYTYGLPALATVILMEASLLWHATRNTQHATRFTRRWIWLLGPFALAMLFWFARPYKIAEFWSYATAQPAHRSWNLETLLFYPRSITFHHTPSPLFALVTLIGVVWAASRWRDPRLRLLLIYFGVGVGEMTLNFPKDPRFIATFVPAAHVLTGAMLTWCLECYRQSSLNKWWGIVAILLVVSLIMAVPVLSDRFRTYPSLMEVAYETHPKLNDLAAWIQAQIPPGERVYLINFWDQFGPWALTWYLGTHDLQPGTRIADLSMPSALLQEPSSENIAALREEIRASGVRYVVAFEGTPWGEPVWWIYADGMSDLLTPVTREVMYVDLYDTGGWLKRSLLRQDEWERVKADGRYTLQVQTTVYVVTPDACEN